MAAASGVGSARARPRRAVPGAPAGRRRRVGRAARPARSRPRRRSSSTPASPSKSAISGPRRAPTGGCEGCSSGSRSRSSSRSSRAAWPSRRQREASRFARPWPTSPASPPCPAASSSANPTSACCWLRPRSTSTTRPTPGARCSRRVQTHPLLEGLIYGADSGLEAAVFSPDGTLLATPTSDGTGTILWDTATRRQRRRAAQRRRHQPGRAISPDGSGRRHATVDRSGARDTCLAQPVSGGAGGSGGITVRGDLTRIREAGGRNA